MESIKGALQGAIKLTGIDERRMEECKALFLWDKVAPSLVTKTQPVGITRGRMSVNVTDSVVLHQLSFYKKEYIDRINQMMGRRVVRDITFRVGKVEGRGQVAESRDEYIERLHNVELDQSEMAQIDEITAQIEDDELRNSLRELFVSQSQLDKIRDNES
jgi:hypothetical protein